jgi:drug/metabolite transporter (DMT)-like permease
MPPLHVIAPFLFVLLWSTGFIGAKFGLPYAEPLTFLFWRYLLLLLAVTGTVPALDGVLLARSKGA